MDRVLDTALGGRAEGYPGPSDEGTLYAKSGCRMRPTSLKMKRRIFLIGNRMVEVEEKTGIVAGDGEVGCSSPDEEREDPVIGG